jgi:hypothetical protein
VGESPEGLFPADPAVGEADRFGWPGADSGWGELSEGTVRPGGIAMLQVPGQRVPLTACARASSAAG